MRDNYYVYKNKSLDNFPCVSMEYTRIGKAALEENSDDNCLSGEHGEILFIGQGTYRALIVNPTGSEKIITFKSKDLGRWISRLKVPLDPAIQAEYANNPNNRKSVAERYKTAL